MREGKKERKIKGLGHYRVRERESKAWGQGGGGGGDETTSIWYLICQEDFITEIDITKCQEFALKNIN